MVNDFLMNIETQTADEVLKQSLNSSTYIRMQTETTAQLDSYKGDNIQTMIQEGNDMFDKPNEPATKD